MAETPKSERPTAEHEGYQYYKSVVDSVHDAVVVIDRDLKITMMNRSAMELFQVEDISLHSIDDFLPARFQGMHHQHLDEFDKGATMSRQMHARNIVMGQKLDGNEVPLEITISKFAVDDGQFQYVAVLRDCTDHVEYVGELKKFANFDALTGIYNRRHFQEKCIQALQLSRSSGQPLSLALLDLDNFKEVNDQLGHSVGDQLLMDFSQALKQQKRATDIVARWGGDEFIILLPMTQLKDARVWAQRFHQDMQPLLAEKCVSLSIGLTQVEKNEAFNQVFDRADKLLYEAKAAGKDQIAS